MSPKHKANIILCMIIWLPIVLLVADGITNTYLVSKGLNIKDLPYTEQSGNRIVVVSIEMKDAPRYREITQYNAGDPTQTDDTPCISANGENICTALALGYNRCATNSEPFGTVLEVKGLGTCMVVDRMNSRYSEEVNWALTAEQKTKALVFGRKELLVTVKY